MKVIGPLFSMRAKGTFQGITFKDYPGEDNSRVTRAHFKQNIKNIKQDPFVKDAFALSVELWKDLTSEEKLSWDGAAYGVEKEHGEKVWQPELAGYHKMIGKNVRLALAGRPLKRIPF
jgi:hypothetical protein